MEQVIQAVQELGVSTVLLLGLSALIWRVLRKAGPLMSRVVESHLEFLRSQASTNMRLEKLLHELVQQVASLDERIERLEQK
jgi:cobalamin biosynthesis protein CbiD